MRRGSWRRGWRLRRHLARVFLGGLMVLGLGACHGFEERGATAAPWLRLGDSDDRVRQLLGAAETQRTVPAVGGIGGVLWVYFTAGGRFETRMDDGRLVRTQGLELLLDQGRVVKILPDPNAEPARRRPAPAPPCAACQGWPGRCARPARARRGRHERGYP